MKLSRRELAVAALAASAAKGQTASADLAQDIRDANRRDADLLSKIEIPPATEPAFQFKA